MDSTKNKEELQEAAKIINNLLESVDNRMSELDDREQKWKKLEEQVEDNASKLKSKVILDIGGTRFVTSKATLLLHKNSYFSALFASSRFQPEQDGSYFVDRSPEYFALILDFMRSGKLRTTHLNKEQLDGLREELDYYQIGVASKCVKSSIVSIDQIQTLEGWIGKKLGNLLWRATEHGFEAKQFHDRCDNKGPTVVIIKSSEGWLFGGYAGASWNSMNSYISNGDSFIFTLTNPHNITPTRYSCKTDSYTLYGAATYGPKFGGGHGLHVSCKSNINSSSYSNFPHGFHNTTGKGNNTFTGNRNFTTADIEVFDLAM